MSCELIKKIVFELEYVRKDQEVFYDESHCRETLMDYLIDSECGFSICWEGNKIKGLLMCYTYQPFVSNSSFKRSQDLLIQPDPQLTKREKVSVFNLLLKEYESWSKKMKVKEMFIGINTRNDIRPSMERKGFLMADYVMKKEVL